MHDQSYDISTDLEKLERELDYIRYPNHCVHAGPIIRQEQEYRFGALPEFGTAGMRGIIGMGTNMMNIY